MSEFKRQDKLIGLHCWPPLILVFCLFTFSFKDREMLRFYFQRKETDDFTIVILIVFEVVTIVIAVVTVSLLIVLLDIIISIQVDLSTKPESSQHSLLHQLLGGVKWNVHTTAACVSRRETILRTINIDAVFCPLVNAHVATHKLEHKLSVFRAHLAKDLPKPIRPLFILSYRNIILNIIIVRHFNNSLKSLFSDISLRAGTTAGQAWRQMCQHSLAYSVLDSHEDTLKL